MKILCTTFTILLSVGLATAAAAQGPMSDPGGNRQARVSYADLDLSTAAGLKAMDSRVELAASQVCGPRPAPIDLRSSSEFRACKAKALGVAGVDIANAAAQRREAMRVLAAAR